MEINYNQIVQKKDIFLKYLFHNSEFFSLIETKSFNQNFDSESFIDKLSPFLVKIVSEKQLWLPHITKQKNEIMCIYRCCSTTQRFLIDKFDCWWNDRTGIYSDVCFYQDKHPWFYCINHETLAFINAQRNDVAFFDMHNIQYWGDENDINENTKNYLLPI